MENKKLAKLWYILAYLTGLATGIVIGGFTFLYLKK